MNFHSSQNLVIGAKQPSLYFHTRMIGSLLVVEIAEYHHLRSIVTILRQKVGSIVGCCLGSAGFIQS